MGDVHVDGESLAAVGATSGFLGCRLLRDVGPAVMADHAGFTAEDGRPAGTTTDNRC